MAVVFYILSIASIFSVCVHKTSGLNPHELEQTITSTTPNSVDDFEELINDTDNTDVGDFTALLTQMRNDKTDLTKSAGNGVFSKNVYKPTVPYELPVEWEQFCSVGNEFIYESDYTNKTIIKPIKCHVNSQYSGKWSMNDLRTNMMKYANTSLKFSLEITCESMSNIDLMNNISLFWPIKVSNLYEVRVKGCRIYDFLLEHDSKYLETPDSLRVIDITDSVIFVSIKRFIKMGKMIQHISKEYNCGHETTVEWMRLRNINYDFIDDIVLTPDELTAFGEQIILDAHRITYKCDYKHLTYLDEGGAKSLSVYHMDLTSANGIYYSLKSYNLSYSYLKVLQDQHIQWSANYPKLELFDLSHNTISKLYRFEVPLSVRNGPNKITTIDLQYNNISTITVKDLHRFSEMPMVFFDLRNNPIFCNCSQSLTDLLNYISKEQYKTISNVSDYSYLKDLVCFGPDTVRGKTLYNLTLDTSLCEKRHYVKTEYLTTPVVILSACVVFLIIILLLVLKFRQEIQIVMFTRFNIIIPCQQREDNFEDKKYHAFVSYSSNEEDWVEPLFEELEKQSEEKVGQKFKFCLHHRDFIPGRTIFENVINSVESSRHTIILLSNHFLKSEYCLYEFQEAFRQSIMEQRRHLVIVMVENIDENLVPRDLKRCMKTFTYIRKDDFLFVERLVFALSIKPKSKVVKSDPESKISSSVSFKKILSSSSSDKTDKFKRKSESLTNSDLEAVISIPKFDSPIINKQGSTHSNNSKRDSGKSKNKKRNSLKNAFNKEKLKLSIKKSKSFSKNDEICDVKNEIKKNGSSHCVYTEPLTNENQKCNYTVTSEQNDTNKTSDATMSSDKNKQIPFTQIDKKNGITLKVELDKTDINRNSNVYQTNVEAESPDTCDVRDEKDVFLEEMRVGKLNDKLGKLVIGYDRSVSLMSQDTGYASDRTSNGDNLSPDICSFSLGECREENVCIV